MHALRDVFVMILPHIPQKVVLAIIFFENYKLYFSRWLAVVIHHAVAGEITFTQETQKENLKSGVGKPLDNLSNAVYTFLLLYFAI